MTSLESVFICTLAVIFLVVIKCVLDVVLYVIEWILDKCLKWKWSRSVETHVAAGRAAEGQGQREHISSPSVPSRREMSLLFGDGSPALQRRQARAGSAEEEELGRWEQSTSPSAPSQKETNGGDYGVESRGFILTSDIRSSRTEYIMKHLIVKKVLPEKRLDDGAINSGSENKDNSIFVRETSKTSKQENIRVGGDKGTSKRKRSTSSTVKATVNVEETDTRYVVTDNSEISNVEQGQIHQPRRRKSDICASPPAVVVVGDKSGTPQEDYDPHNYLDGVEAATEAGRVSHASCAICLGRYEQGESICWATNPSCNHVFHRDCIIEWLMTRKNCPCCRTNYFYVSNANMGSGEG